MLKPVLGSQIRLGHPMANGLVGCWVMNEGAGNIAQDSSGNGITGTLVADTHWVPGKFGSALSFDGNGDYVSFDAMPINEFPFTVSALVNASTITTNHTIFIFEDASNATVYQGIRISSGFWQIISRDSDSGFKNVTYAGVAVNEWHVLTAVFANDTNKSMYLNGVQVANLTDDVEWDSGLDRVIVGRRGTTDYFAGKMDCLCLYNRALSAQEISELYMNPFAMFERTPIELWTGAMGGGAPPTDNAGIMTTWGGYWGATY